MNIEIGAKLFANYGAMFPTEEFEVIGFGKDYAVAQNEDEVKHFPLSNIKREGERSVNGSPIGVFLIEEKKDYNPNPQFAGDWDDYYDC